MKDLNEYTAQECLENGVANLENLERFFPQIKTHPIYTIAKGQITNALQKLEQK